MRARLKYLATTGWRRALRDRVVGPDTDPFVVREDLARRYVRGDGIEIGAAMFPTRLPRTARARYVDRQSKADMLRLEPEFINAAGKPPEAIPETDVIDDAATLATFADGSLDFVVANHVLEHIQDPIAALRNLVRVLRPGGILFLTLPDARYSFDHLRERTSVEHLLRDHAEGPAVSRRAHYAEWAQFIEGRGGAALEQRVAEYEAQDAHHHWHVWELPGFVALLHALDDLPAELVHAVATKPEFSVILRRAAPATAGA